ncbi:MAG: Asp23/Gls24 family envelope stress response protein [Oscillospiraceae bacterium]|nr:Asp23/Gls24 family envelope stress response protein [Oscillospiraceae bacterium]
MSETKDYISYTDESGSVNISEDVLAVLAGGAAAETEGVYALYPSYGRDIGELLSKKALSRSVKTVIDGQSVALDIYIVAELGSALARVGEKVQKSVAEAVEAAIGVKPTAVNVHVCGVSLKKGK